MRQQAITWANVDPDLCRHMASQGHNELTHWPLGDVAVILYYNMTVWILARNDIIFSMAAGLIRLHMPGVK